MYAAQLTFRIPEGVDLNDVSWKIVPLLAGWQQNGQIYRDNSVLVATDGNLVEAVTLPERDALDDAHASEHIRRDLAELAAIGIPHPELIIVGEDIEDYSRACSCLEQTAYILATDFTAIYSPLHCGSCYLPVPLYRLPPVDGSGFYSLLRWQADYRACDTLQIGCETLERAALHEMGQVDSSLSKRGRAICDRITESTGVPTFYYLHRWYGRSLKQERARKCPSCGGEWLLDEPWHRHFAFRCDRCRLVSNISDQV